MLRPAYPLALRIRLLAGKSRFLEVVRHAISAFTDAHQSLIVGRLKRYTRYPIGFHWLVVKPNRRDRPLAQRAKPSIHLERSMKKITPSRLLSAGLLAASAFISSALFAATTGEAIFTAENRAYVGTYSTSDKLVSVEIDGLTYKGYYASHAQDDGRAATQTPDRGWGRAFLFSSSANVLRCALDTGFPKVSGQCQGSDGRSFQLTPEMLEKNASPKLSSTK